MGFDLWFILIIFALGFCIILYIYICEWLDYTFKRKYLESKLNNLNCDSYKNFCLSVNEKISTINPLLIKKVENDIRIDFLLKSNSYKNNEELETIRVENKKLMTEYYLLTTTCLINGVVPSANKKKPLNKPTENDLKKIKLRKLFSIR